MTGHLDIYGTMGVLSVGQGDTKLSFDPENPQDRIRAARIVKDMLRRGYALLVEVERDGVRKFERALDFDESRCVYIIADFDPVAAEKADQEETREETVAEAAASGGASGREAPAPKFRSRVKRGPRRREIDASKTRGVAVARSAGG